MELNNGQIRNIAMIIAILGIIGLSYFTNPPATEITISEINETHEYQKIVTQGKILSTKITKGVLIFEIFDKSQILAVIFSPTEEQKSLVRKNAYLKFEGTVKKYKGKLELVVEKVNPIV